MSGPSDHSVDPYTHYPARSRSVGGSHPLWAPVVLVAWLVTLVASRWIALASVCAALSLVGVAFAAGVDRPWGAFLGLLVLWRHRANLAGGRSRPQV